MSNRRKTIIKDACILFDLIQLELLDSFFELDFLVYTSTHVLEEVLDTNQKSLINRHIQLKNLIIDDNFNDDFVFELRLEFRGLSITDCTLVDLAIRKKALLLTSDKSLGKVSKSFRLEVHGLLWVIATLKKNGIISAREAIKSLRLYCEINRRAPMKTIEALIERLKQ